MVSTKVTSDLACARLNDLSCAGLRSKFSPVNAPTEAPVETPPDTKPDVKPEPDIIPDREPVREPNAPLGPRPDSPCPLKW